MTIIQINFTF